MQALRSAAPVGKRIVQGYPATVLLREMSAPGRRAARHQQRHGGTMLDERLLGSIAGPRCCIAPTATRTARTLGMEMHHVRIPGMPGLPLPPRPNKERLAPAQVRPTATTPGQP